jgi:hypothetical protein
LLRAWLLAGLPLLTVFRLLPVGTPRLAARLRFTRARILGLRVAAAWLLAGLRGGRIRRRRGLAAGVAGLLRLRRLVTAVLRPRLRVAAARVVGGWRVTGSTLVRAGLPRFRDTGLAGFLRW